MSAHSDSVPVQLGGAAVARPSLSRARSDRDLELMAQVARGDIDATELLAERMAPRALRVARSLMVGPDDAADAALHALIELLRSHARYRGQLRLERWADRVMALSVVRFARAVRRRDHVEGTAPPELAPGRSEPTLARTGATQPRVAGPRVDERSARTFEQYLALLPEQSRQILLLRHGLAFALGELSEALQCSLPVAREQLRDARRELRGLVRRKSDGGAAVLGEGAQRWCTLRDREALGESLAPDEHEELKQLETRDPEVWAFVAQVRALELFFDAARETPQSAAEHELAARSVAALEITSPTMRTRALAPASEAGPDFEGSRWVRRLALGSSISLAAASVVALWLYQPPASPALELPRSVRAPVLSPAERVDAAVRAARGAAEASTLRPTVEALPTARTALRGARLRSAGRLLPEGALLTQGDTVETSDRPGCLRVEPDAELCLAPLTQLKLSSLMPRERRLELLTGRIVARFGPLSESARWLVRAGEVEVQAARAVFSVERLPDGKLLRVRTLRAAVELHAAEVTRSIAEAKSASVRTAGGPIDVVALLPSQAQRDWELLAIGLYPAAPSAATPTLTKSTPPAAFAASSTGAQVPVLAPAVDDSSRARTGEPSEPGSGAASATSRVGGGEPDAPVRADPAPHESAETRGGAPVQAAFVEPSEPPAPPAGPRAQDAPGEHAGASADPARPPGDSNAAAADPPSVAPETQPALQAAPVAAQPPATGTP